MYQCFKKHYAHNKLQEITQKKTLPQRIIFNL